MVLIFCVEFWELSHLKPNISSHSKPHTRSHTRHLKCFVLNTLCYKRKHLKQIVQDLLRGSEWLEILGLTRDLSQAQKKINVVTSWHSSTQKMRTCCIICTFYIHTFELYNYIRTLLLQKIKLFIFYCCL